VQAERHRRLAPARGQPETQDHMETEGGKPEGGKEAEGQQKISPIFQGVAAGQKRRSPSVLEAWDLVEAQAEGRVRWGREQDAADVQALGEEKSASVAEVAAVVGAPCDTGEGN